MPPTTRKATPDETAPDSSAPSNSAAPNLASNAIATEEGGAAAQKAVQERTDVETAQGFRGTAPDPTPNHNYTLAGVTDPDKHVPEEYKTQTGVVKFPGDVVADNA